MATRHSYAGTSQNFNGAQEGQGVMGQVKAAGEAVQSQAQHTIEDYPLSTVLAVFGVGLGVGVVLGSSLFCASSSSSSPESMFSGWWPSSSSSQSWFPAMSSGSHGSWFGNNPQNWTDSMVRNAKSMCGY